MTGYQALHDSAAFFDLSSRGRIRLTGEDRARLLHALSTNHVQDLHPGQSLYAFFLNAQGRILADALIFCADDHHLLDLEPEVSEKIYAHLDKYIIADDVTLEDVAGATAEIAVEGPGAQSLRSAAGPGSIIIDASGTGQPGFRVILPAADKPRLISALVSMGAVDAAPEETEIVRLENGCPRYGQDMTEANLAQETGLTSALHFNKGCYLGQEIVERVRSRGHVNKLLSPLRVSGTDVPGPGTPVMAGDAQSGAITSAAFSPRENCVRALAYLRPEHLRGTPLAVKGAPAQVVQKA